MGPRMQFVAAARRFRSHAARAPRAPSPDPAPAGGAGPTFDAFLSYSRAVDGRLAPALQSALQRFAKPWFRMREKHIFRDDASLSANPGLWSSIEQALKASQFFILLASPDAAASKWVTREVSRWLQNGAAERFLIVLTDGELVWDETRGEFDPEQTTALPQPALGAFTEEPRYTDLRWAGTQEHLSLSDPRFRDAVADVAAPLHDRPKDELIGEEVRQHRLTVRLARAAVLCLTLFAVAAIVSAIFAVRGQNVARTERDRAREQARLATSRQLAAQARAVADEGEIDLALLLAAQSLRMSETREARDALLATLQRVPKLEGIRQFASTTSPTATMGAASTDGRVAALLRDDGNVEVVKRLQKKPATLVYIPTHGQIIALGISPDGNVVAVGNRGGAVALHGLPGNTPTRTFPPLPQPPGEEGPFQASSFALSRNGRLVAWNGASISVWNGRTIHKLVPGVKAGSWLLAFDRDARRLAAASTSDGTTVVWRLQTSGLPSGRPTVFRAGSGDAPGAFGPPAVSLAFDPRRPHVLAVGGADGAVGFWDTSSGRRIARIPGGAGANSLAFSPDGRRLLAKGDGTVNVWDIARRVLVGTFPTFSFGQAVAFLPDSRRVVMVGSRAVATWYTAAKPSQLARTLQGADTGITALAYDPTGSLLATLGEQKIRLWDASTLRPAQDPLATGWQTLGIAFTPDGRAIAAWPSAGAPLALWSLDGKRTRVSGLGSVAAVAFTSDAEAQALTVHRGRLRLWSAPGPRAASRTLEMSSNAGIPFAFSSSAGTAAASTHEGKALRLWRANTGRVLRGNAIDAPAAVAFSGNGKLLAGSSWDNSTIKLWNPMTGREIGQLVGGKPADALALDERGELLAAMTSDLSSRREKIAVQLWNVHERERLGSEDLAQGTGVGYEDMPQVAFSPDAKALAVLGLEARPYVFDLEPSTWAGIACRLAGRDLTQREWRRYVGPGFGYEPTCPST